MKKLRVFVLVLTFVLTLVGCGNKPKADTGDLPPMITIDGYSYVAPYMPVDGLPDGYAYLGELSEEDANDTGLAGCKMYAVLEKDSFTDFYLYQECGTPIDENTLDPEQRQWAYVQWISTGKKDEASHSVITEDAVQQ